MKDKMIKNLQRTYVSTHYLRLLAGGYVDYLAYDIIRGFIRGETADHLLLALAILLALCGIYLVIVSLYALINRLGIDKAPQYSLFGRRSEPEESAENDTDSDEDSESPS